MSLTEETRAAAAEIIARYPEGRSRSALLPMLHLVQAEEGYVTPQGIAFCAEALGLTKAEVGAVATFYTMYKRRPVGEYLVSVCTNLSCQILGGEDVFTRLSKRLGVHHNETTEDGSITLEHTTLVPLLLIPVVLAAVVAFRRRDRVARSLLVMLAVTVVAAVVSVARTAGQMYEYRLLWTWTLGALVTAAAAFALWRGLRSRCPASFRPVLIGILVATLFGLAVAHHGTHHIAPGARDMTNRAQTLGSYSRSCVKFSTQARIMR